MGFIYLLIAGSLWGILGPMSRFSFAEGLTPLETAFWRGTIAGICFAVHYGVVTMLKRTHQQMMLSPRQWPNKLLVLVCLFGIIGVAMLEGCYVYAVHYGGAALASVLLYSAPIWVNIVGVTVWKEKICAKQWTALAITFSGIVGISLWGAQVHASVPAIVCGLLSGLGYALFYVAGNYFFRHTNPVTIFMVAFPIGSAALLVFLYGINDFSPVDILNRFAAFSLSAQMSVVAVGIVCTYLPYLFYAAGLRRVDAGKAAIITMIEPVVAISAAHIFWNEEFSSVGYFFCALVLIGVIMVSHTARNESST